MNKKTIRRYVNETLKLEKISSPPINPERIAESYFDLDFDCGKLRNNQLAGLNISEKKIYFNESRADELNANIGLKNFTIAHELGHWVLHKDLPIGERSPQNEREADIFATYLLMPEQFVREEFAKIKSPFMRSDLYDLAEKFRVSKEAMKIRLSQWELKLIYVDFKTCEFYQSKKEFLEKAAGQIPLF